MTDERLRELERRWKETGSVEDEAAWLVERVRAGDLTQERLGLAAHCGHPAALELVPRKRRRSFKVFVNELLSFGRQACLRACVAAGRAALPHARHRVLNGWIGLFEEDLHRAEQALQAGAEWLECPCGEHEATCRQWSDLRVPAWADIGLLIDGKWEELIAPILLGAATAAGKKTPVRAAICNELSSWALDSVVGHD